MKSYKYWLFALLLGGLFSCEPHLDDKTELGPIPNPSFEIMQGSTLNEFVLVNTTDGTFLTQWDLGSLGSKDGEEATVAFPFMGTYDITMTTFNQGGSASLTKQVVVTQNDPNACSGNMELLTGCGQKTWKLAAEANALFVGPNITDPWWGNSDTDLATRACHFDDEYIFTVDGAYIYDNKGDFWADDDGNGNVVPSDLGLPTGCNTTWPETYDVWGSGTHAFSVTDNSLTVSGLGAWIGLYKIGTSSEVATPQTSVTFSISEISDNRLVLFTDYGGVVWRITLTSS